MPRYDNMFGGGNYDSHDLDEWLTIQRDWQVDAGIEPLAEADAIAVRERAARAVQAVYDGARLPADHRRGGRGSPPAASTRATFPTATAPPTCVAGDRVLADGIGGLDVARALARRGFDDVAAAVFDMQRQRVAADYLQTSAIIGARRPRRLGGQRPERLPRAGHRLPA